MQASNRNGLNRPFSADRQINPPVSRTVDPLSATLNHIAHDLGYQRQSLPSHLSTRETAKVLHISMDTLAQWRTKGRHNLQFKKPGRYVFYCTQGIAKFIQSRTYTGTCQYAGGAK